MTPRRGTLAPPAPLRPRRRAQAAQLTTASLDVQRRGRGACASQVPAASSPQLAAQPLPSGSCSAACPAPWHRIRSSSENRVRGPQCVCQSAQPPTETDHRERADAAPATTGFVLVCPSQARQGNLGSPVAGPPPPHRPLPRR